MRIVAGDLKGLRLAVPSGGSVRPTTDRVRESLFNILAHESDWRRDDGPCPAGWKVLDVFAGTGALGLEALSRGATQVGFMENAPESLALLKQNQRKARADGRTSLFQRDATRPGRVSTAFDLVLMDPPYRSALAGLTLQALADAGWLADEAIAVVECDKRDQFAAPEGFVVEKQRTYGRTQLTFLRRADV